MLNEARARIKINHLLSDAGWRFFDNAQGPANILLKNHVKISQQAIDAWGNDYEKTTHGSLDFLLVDNQNKPVCALKAKPDLCIRKTSILHDFNELEIISHCLFEMTFMGYDEKVIQDELSSLKDTVDEIQNWDEDEKKLKLKSLDDWIEELGKDEE